MTGRGLVRVVCVVHRDVPDSSAVGRTAIDKRPVSGPVHIGPLGLAGDHVCDVKHHGGADQAVYVYTDEDAAHWEKELGRELAPGWFGENFRLTGIDATHSVIGSHWQIGAAADGPLLEVTIPRTPCATFGRWAREPQWVRRFAQHGAVGLYLRVLREGAVRAGDPVTVVHVPDHGVTIHELFTGQSTAGRIARLLEEPEPAFKVQRDASKLLRRLESRMAAR